jgi:hypothetical protein
MPCWLFFHLTGRVFCGVSSPPPLALRRHKRELDPLAHVDKKRVDRMRHRYTTPALEAARSARRRESRVLQRKFARYPKYRTERLKASP